MGQGYDDDTSIHCTIYHNLKKYQHGYSQVSYNPEAIHAPPKETLVYLRYGIIKMAQKPIQTNKTCNENTMSVTAGLEETLRWEPVVDHATPHG